MDHTGTLYGHVIGDRFFIHARITEAGPSFIRHYRDVIQLMEDQLKLRGVTEYYTLADSVESFRFNETMGFKTNLEVWNDTFEVMKKAI